MRLVVLSASVIGAGALLGGAYTGMKIYRSHQHEQLKPKGLAALKAGELVPALNMLGSYLNWNQNDMEVLKTYAELREKLPQPGYRHIAEAIPLYRRLAAINPSDLSYRQKLLKLYFNGNMNTEMIQGGDELVRQVGPELLGKPQSELTKMDVDELVNAEIQALQKKYAVAAGTGNWNDEARTRYVDPMIDALHYKTEALLRMLKPQDAEHAARELVALDPKVPESGDLLLRSMYASKDPQAAIVAQVNAVIKGREDQAASLILKARMYAVQGDLDAAKKEATRAAKLEMPTEELARSAADLLDRFEEFDLARGVIDAAVAKFHSDDLQEEYFRRMIYREQYKQASDELGAIDISKRASLTGLRIFAMWQYGEQLTNAGNKADGDHQKDSAKLLLKPLDLCAEKWDLRAKSWGDVLRLMYFTPKARERDLVDACKDAASGDIQNPLFAWLLGNALEATGDSNEAVRQWARASQLAPSWSRPLYTAAYHFMRVGDAVDALLLARKADVRLPDQKENLVLIAQAWGNALGAPNVDSPANLLKFIADHPEQLKNDPRVAPLRVVLLARTNQAAAAGSLVEEIIGRATAADGGLLLSLGAACREARLEKRLQEACFAKYEQQQGPTVDVAVARCQQMLIAAKEAESKRNTAQADARDATAAGDSAAAQRFTAEAAAQAAVQKQMETAARTEFENRAKVASGASDEVRERWDLARCQLLEALKDPEAHDRWKALADGRPQNLKLQWSTVSAASVHEDHALLGALLDRIKTLEIEPTLRWRVQKGDWLIREGSAASLDKAVSLMRETAAAWQGSVQARQELAAAYVAVGNRSAALAELTRAAELEPQNVDVQLNLADLYLQQKDVARATEQLKKATAVPLSEQQQLRAGMLLAQAGDRKASSDLLLNVSGSSNPMVLQLQAQLLWQKGDKHGALPKYQRILDTDAAPQMIQQALGFFRSLQNDLDPQLRQAGEEGLKTGLAKLGSIKGSEAQRHFAMGSYYAQSGNYNEGIPELAAAVKLDAGNEEYWRKLLAAQLAGNKIDDALKTAADASTALQQDPTCLVLANLGVNKVILNDFEVRSYFALCISTAGNNRAINDVAAVLRTAKSVDASELASQLQRLANANRDSVPLQVLAIQKLIRAGRIADALTQSQQAMLDNPTSPQPAYYTTLNLISLGRWSDALSAAQRWREIAPPTNSVDPDLILASTYLGVNRPKDATVLLENAIKILKQDDPDFRTATQLLIAADVQQNNLDSAKNRLLAQIRPEQTDAFWRQYGSRLATDQILRLNTATGRVDRAAEAGKWLTDIAARTAADDIDGHMVLGLAWYRLAKRAKDPKIEQQAWLEMEPVLTGTGGDVALRARSIAIIGTLKESDSLPESEKLPEAEKLYRRALELDPSLHPAMNNLAMALARQNKDFGEAESLIQRAEQAMPKFASYFDTHAFVLRKEKKYDEALKVIETAISLDRQNPEWVLSKAEIQVDAGKLSLASDTMKVAVGLDVKSRPDLKARVDQLGKKLQQPI
jgi:tetratricopeptide (TPR) repeat protein/DNA-binding SARP family transcriptional activator